MLRLQDELALVNWTWRASYLLARPALTPPPIPARHYSTHTRLQARRGRAFLNTMEASNGSYMTALSPASIDSLSASHALSSSISSLSSSFPLARQSSAHITKAYRQASTLFLTRRLPEALSTVLPLVTPPTVEAGDRTAEPAPVAKASRTTRIKVWSLYLTVLNAILELDPDEGKEAFGTQQWKAICSKVREGHVWEDVVRNGYHGADGSVDSEVVINLYGHSCNRPILQLQN